MYRSFLKRLFDFFSALIGLILLSPIFIFVMLFLFVSNGGKPFFIQRRPGKKDRIFNIIKFKTMNDKRDNEGNLLSPDERITKVGGFVRKTSLDEIPQLINVLKGDMSLIGPRPLLVEYLDRYNKIQRRRHEVKPGITGWAQVNGRNAISWEKKFEYDVWYVDNVSFKVDFKILIETLKKVIGSKDINFEKSFKESKFKGASE